MRNYPPARSYAITTLLARVLVFVITLSFVAPVAPVAAASFTVTAPEDLDDVDPGDGRCETDAGTCTLRAAIQETNALSGQDTIDLPSGLYRLDQSELQISDELLISGNDPATTIIQQTSENERIIGIYTDASVTIAGVTISDGHKDDPDDAGGAIFNDGADLTLDTAIITGSSADFGGAIFSQGSLTLKNTTVSNNRGRDGGAIYNPATSPLTLEQVTMINNRATATGGAIYTESDSSLLVTESLFRENHASGANGGALGIAGSAEIRDTTFDYNTAQGYGGALYIEASATVTMTKSDIRANIAYAESGGGLSNFGETTLEGVRLWQNEVRQKSGGGIYNEGTLTLRHSDISGNSATTPYDTMTTADGRLDVASPGISFFGRGSGGGISNELGGTITIETSTIRDNSAIFEGAGLYSRGSGSNVTASTVTLTGNTLMGAWSTYYTEPEKHHWLGEGGAVFNEATMEMRNCRILDNFAGGNGGGISNKDSFALSDCLIAANQAGYENDEYRIGDGGGFNNYYGSLTSSADIARTVIRDNRATIQGGGLYNMSGIVNLEDSAIINNETRSRGGGVYTTVRQDWWRARLNLTNVTISGNRAGLDGGGLANDNTRAGSAEQSWVRLTHVTIAENEAVAGVGGGIYNSHDAGGEEASWIQNSLVARNRTTSGEAAQCGGPIVLTSGGANIGSDASCNAWFTSERDATETNPQIGDLLQVTTAGGNPPTLLHPLLNDSGPAANQVGGGNCAEHDQRLVTRAEPCDIGAAEFVPSGLTLEPYDLDFGARQTNTAGAPQSITLTNTSGSDLTINTITTTSEQFTIDISGCADAAPFRLATGDSCQIDVVFMPTTIGAENGMLALSTSDSIADQRVRLAGVGERAEFRTPDIAPGTDTPWVRITPDPLAFAGQALNTTSAAQPMTLENSGSQPLNVTSITISDTFTLEGGSCGPPPFSVAPGERCTFDIAFTPATIGAISGKLTLESDAPGSPDQAQLTGIGTQAITSLSPDPLAFGTQAINTSATQPLQLQNIGSADLVISEIATTADAFTVTPTCQETPALPLTLPAGGRCVLDVTFTPDSSEALTATLRITSNASSGPQEITLSGTGAANPGVDMVPGTVVFPERLINTTSDTRAVSITNTTTRPLTITNIDVTSAEFAFDMSDCQPDAQLPFMLEAGASCTIAATFTPAGLGVRSATLLIESAAGADTLFLTGSAVGPYIATDPETLDAGRQVLNTTSDEYPLSITNSGTEPLNIASIALNSDAFAISGSNNCDPNGTSTLPIGRSCTLFITFTPPTTGQHIATLAIESDATMTPYQVKLRGFGLQEGQELVPGTPELTLTIEHGDGAFAGADSHPVTPGTLVPYHLHYTNAGNAIAEDARIIMDTTEWAHVNRFYSAPGWQQSNGQALFPIGDIAPGESGDVLVMLAIAPHAPAETQIPIQAVIESAANTYSLGARAESSTMAMVLARTQSGFILYLPVLTI